jgi:hypothetical protein
MVVGVEKAGYQGQFGQLDETSSIASKADGLLCGPHQTVGATVVPGKGTRIVNTPKRADLAPGGMAH